MASSDNQLILKIFIPQDIFISSSLFLVSHKTDRSDVYIVHDVLDLKEGNDFMQNISNRSQYLVGVWNYDDNDLFCYFNEVDYIIKSNRDGNIDIETFGICRTNYSYVMILKYSSSNLLQSVFLKEDVIKPSEHHYDESGLNDSKSIINTVMTKLKELTDEKKKAHKRIEITSIAQYVRFAVNILFFQSLFIFVPVLKRMKQISGSTAFSKIIWILNSSSTIVQLKFKAKIIEKASIEINGTPMQWLRCMNFIVKIWFDIALGIMMMLILMNYDIPAIANRYILDWGFSLVQELKILITWLMGFPAGLKLNQHLDNFLGNFFLYHIYLWNSYLETILKPILKDLLWYICVSGCFGLTFQLSLLQDLCMMMTLHLHCFYVYTSRLHKAQVCGLSSLWRLFRGKKWNDLRKRVDSIFYDVDQLFIGTLLFTILLFLFPTTALYYLVFMSIQLSIYLITGVINCMQMIINGIPVYSFMLKLFKSKIIADSIIYGVKPGRPLILSLKFDYASWTRLWCITDDLKEFQFSAITVIKRIIRGDFIFTYNS